jgi:hypothetical protein
MSENHQPAQPVPKTIRAIQDLSRSTNFRLCQQHFQGTGHLRFLPTVTVNGNRYDIRQLTADQIDLLDKVGCFSVEEVVFQSAGLNPRMHKTIGLREMLIMSGEMLRTSD